MTAICDAIANDIGKSSVEKVIVARSLILCPLPLRPPHRLKVKSPRFDGKVFQSWKAFIREGFKHRPSRRQRRTAVRWLDTSYRWDNWGAERGNVFR